MAALLRGYSHNFGNDTFTFYLYTPYKGHSEVRVMVSWGAPGAVRVSAPDNTVLVEWYDGYATLPDILERLGNGREFGVPNWMRHAVEIATS